jgi:glycosyltransferase 2 family protein
VTAARRWARRTVTVAVLAASAVFLVRSCTSGSADVAGTVARIGPWLLVAEVPLLAGLWLTALAWREPLRHLSGPLSRAQAVRLFAAGQLGKYVPGVMWSVVLQARLAEATGITTAQIAAAFGVYAAVSIVTGAAVGAPAAVLTAAGPLLAVLTAVAAGALLAATPYAVTAAIGLARRVPVVGRRLTAVPRDTLRRSVLLNTASWLVSGAHLWVLAVALGAGPESALIPCLGGFALGTALGSLVVVVPDGIGIRESVLALALTSCLPPAEAAVAALGSRLLLASADVIAFAYGTWAGRRARRPLAVRHTIGELP